MTDKKDIVERLRSSQLRGKYAKYDPLKEAADEIERLREKVEGLEEWQPIQTIRRANAQGCRRTRQPHNAGMEGHIQMKTKDEIVDKMRRRASSVGLPNMTDDDGLPYSVLDVIANALGDDTVKRSNEVLDEMMDRALDALHSAGFAVVPLEPTPEMLDAGQGHFDCYNEQYVKGCYKDMVQAGKG